MPYGRHALLQFGGPLLGSEIWSCSLRLVPDVLSWTDGDFRDSCEAVLNDVANDVVSYLTAPGSGWSGRAELAYVKLNPIRADGRYLDQENTIAKYFPSPYPASSATTVMPHQVALAVSLRTDADRGLASKGRFYVPCPAVDLDTGKASVTADRCGAVARAARDFIRNLNNRPGPDMAGWASVAICSDRGNAISRKVTQVRVGNRLDTVRRRANGLPETYYSEAI